MQKKVIEKWQRVSILWIDSVSIRIARKSWHSFDEVENAMNESGSYITTVGYKFTENKHWVAVAMSLSFEGNEVVLFGDPMLIPKGCIKEIKKI